MLQFSFQGHGQHDFWKEKVFADLKEPLYFFNMIFLQITLVLGIGKRAGGYVVQTSVSPNSQVATH
ncbi:hypothetical protein B7H23_04730 [Notoacmeibacter marinus]|uniref:Uncharacterized protein n=1 Tax=Notoacmeibacter marinus TaxID=1876515 RepID=A0A231V280_9HYPH|nr:hypothetical protein B7H23_04730 [Notoacmeibacter marinus]